MLDSITIYEPMLRHSVCIHIWSQWAKDYTKVTTHNINISIQDWACYSEPIDACYHIWIDSYTNIPTLTHELYHVTTQLRELTGLCEEAWAYYIWYVMHEYLSGTKLDKKINSIKK